MSELPSEPTPDEFDNESQDEVQPDVPNKQKLDLCLLKQLLCRKIQRFGTVQVFHQIYQGDCLLDPQIDRVSIRYDSSNIIYILAYTEEKVDTPSQFLGVLKIRDRKKDKLSLTNLRLEQRLIRERSKTIEPY
ncbi:Mu transposase C-terminal domain-containing protein [Nodosilinea nodulosa]|uniref:Mu transposase C-terminal domain-containing protein n=1 Tax=Nodosilinea nodulosa TaxID=416001 RepID=UPI0012D8478A|nr:Mu transposase C-terminal domain-containing protein [Nodosilinea nodulosa]